jgi:hypothetical protein
MAMQSFINKLVGDSNPKTLIECDYIMTSMVPLATSYNGCSTRWQWTQQINGIIMAI